jgi:hypothetical protein
VLVGRIDRGPLPLDLGSTLGQPSPQAFQMLRDSAVDRFVLVHRKTCYQDLQTANSYRVCGKPRSTFDVAGSGHRDVTTFERV